MKVLITGSHGLIGTQLISLLKSMGDEPIRLVRSSSRPSLSAPTSLANSTAIDNSTAIKNSTAEPSANSDSGSSDIASISWNPEIGEIDKQNLEGIEGVVNLGGESIAAGRWTKNTKKRIRASRETNTRFLCDALASLNHKPKVIVSGSAIGFYGNRGDEVLTERSHPGTGFLADVCTSWEAATASAEASGIRVVLIRTGMVLSKRGGALTKMLPPFQLGLGGPLGDGKQYMSWISAADIVGIIAFALHHDELSGAINGVSPTPVTNNEFTEALGKALNRPTVLPLPQFAVHMLLGEMADELLFASDRVIPEKLIGAGYRFQHPDLQPLLTQYFA